ncbi:MAG: acyl carrier protein [Acidimicrobiaceae bacterium]|nr:phosphopantetheine-binding protein [Acidimicrobiaceae bacterium]MXW60688.1 acyl carrier protein [Acidimicrobiaceae bacterium]MXW77174.1 acyl carrier protein [Acidimicrobiaceae bacterium]MYA74016.1 acyl carrier protein [Acidimicrobiaceae bacterium]MYC42309.1 acyl carrier protein [Acidimicrobiaceae bacterium]
MSSTEERIRAIVDQTVEIEGRDPGQPLDLSRNVAEVGVSSSDIVAFWRMVNQEFGTDISAEEFAELLTPQDLINHLESAAG